MNVVTICPCCSSPLLHHLDNYREYWFCRHCWSEMPNLVIKEQGKSHNQTPKFDLSVCSLGFKQALSIG